MLQQQKKTNTDIIGPNNNKNIYPTYSKITDIANMEKLIEETKIDNNFDTNFDTKINNNNPDNIPNNNSDNKFDNMNMNTNVSANANANANANVNANDNTDANDNINIFHVQSEKKFDEQFINTPNQLYQFNKKNITNHDQSFLTSPKSNMHHVKQYNITTKSKYKPVYPTLYSNMSNMVPTMIPNVISNVIPNVKSNVMSNFMIKRTNQKKQTSYTNQNYIIDKDALIVETNYKDKKFMFYDRNKNFLGSFSVYEFIKYITSHINTLFLPEINFEPNRFIIEKYVCIVKYNEKSSCKYIINMLNYFESPFMGNIEILIKLYTFIHEYENEELQKELSKLSTNEAPKVLKFFNNMLYTLLDHILKIIAALINKLSSNDNPKIKDSLLNYSVAIMYRLSKFIKYESDSKMDELSILNHDLLRIGEIQTTLSTKIDALQKLIDKQNIEIDILLRSGMMHQTLNVQQDTNINKKNIGKEHNIIDLDEEIEQELDIKQEEKENDKDPISTFEYLSSSIDKSQIYNMANINKHNKNQKDLSQMLTSDMDTDLAKDISTLLTITDKVENTETNSDSNLDKINKYYSDNLKYPTNSMNSSKSPNVANSDNSVNLTKKSKTTKSKLTNSTSSTNPTNSTNSIKLSDLVNSIKSVNSRSNYNMIYNIE